jgi:hypothetical protein
MPTATRIRDHCLAPGRALDAPAAGGYRRLFPELDPLDCEDDALHALGRAGGACDAAAAVALGAGAPDPDAEGAAGWPVFGQFVAHDLTADRSPLTHHAELAEIRNARSPRANLEVVYGDGPTGMLFDLPGRPPAQRAKQIDGRLAASLIRLPTTISGVEDGDDYGSLAVRDLQRGQGVGLPSGEALARRLGVEPLTPEQVGLGPAGWRQETPLWFYLLKEAEHRGGGERLGPVGGRLAGEVLVGIVDADGESYRAVDPGWRPNLPASQAGRFGLADLLGFSASSER